MSYPELDHLDIEQLVEFAGHIEGDITNIRVFLDERPGWHRDTSLKRIAYLETVLAKVRARIAQLENSAQISDRPAK